MRSERASDNKRVPESFTRAMKVLGTACAKCQNAVAVITTGRATEAWCRTCGAAVASERRAGFRRLASAKAAVTAARARAV